MTQTYSKSSFGRYGDDLCELILSYLYFNDKICVECVSTQFCRCVYQKQYELTINEKLFTKLKKTDTLGNQWTDIKAYKTLVKKLTSLKKLIIQYNTFWCKFSKFLDMIEMTLKYCKYLKNIEINFINITDEKVNKLFRKFGPYLTKIEFSDQENLSFGKTFCINNLDKCTNLHDIDIMDIERLFHGKNNCLVKNLKKINFVYFNSDDDYIEYLLKSSKNTLESVIVYFSCYITPIPFTIFMEQLNKLSQLRELRIMFLEKYPFSIVNYLEEISQNCHKLEDFCLNFYSETIDGNIELFNSMKYFKNLKKLYLNLYTDLQPDIPTYFLARSLSECSQLTNLTIRVNISSVNDLFFDDISKYLPNLRYLDVWDADVTECTLMSVSHLKRLRELHLSSSEPKQILENYLYDLIELCPNLRVINLENFETIEDQDVLVQVKMLPTQ